MLDVLRGDLDRLIRRLDANPALVHERFPTLDFGTTGARMLTLRGATLLHVAAEYRNVDVMALLFARGADANARAALAATGLGGQTPLFQAVTQRDDGGLPAVRLLLEHGADRSVRAKVPATTSVRMKSSSARRWALRDGSSMSRADRTRLAPSPS